VILFVLNFAHLIPNCKK